MVCSGRLKEEDITSLEVLTELVEFSILRSHITSGHSACFMGFVVSCSRSSSVCYDCERSSLSAVTQGVRNSLEYGDDLHFVPSCYQYGDDGSPVIPNGDVDNSWLFICRGAIEALYGDDLRFATSCYQYGDDGSPATPNDDVDNSFICRGAIGALSGDCSPPISNNSQTLVWLIVYISLLAMVVAALLSIIVIYFC